MTTKYDAHIGDQHITHTKVRFDDPAGMGKGKSSSVVQIAPRQYGQTVGYFYNTFFGKKEETKKPESNNEIGNNEQKLKYYFKAKKFKFHNNYYTFYRKHNCLRMMDFEIAAYDPNVIKDLDIVNFIHSNQYQDEENLSGAPIKRP